MPKKTTGNPNAPRRARIPGMKKKPGSKSRDKTTGNPNAPRRARIPSNKVASKNPNAPRRAPLNAAALRRIAEGREASKFISKRKK